MQVSLQLRLLDAKGDVLAWNSVAGESKGDGCLWSMQAYFMSEGAGTGDAVELCVAWPEMGVATFVRLPQPLRVEQGHQVGVALTEPLMRFSTSNRAVPPVVVRSSVTVGVPAMSR